LSIHNGFEDISEKISFIVYITFRDFTFNCNVSVPQTE